MRSPEQLRATVSSHVDPPLLSEEWRYLLDARLVPEDWSEVDVEDLVHDVREFRAVWSEWLRLPRGSKRAELMTSGRVGMDPYERALGIVLATEAGQREDVRVFREEVLGGRFLRKNQVRHWIQSTKSADDEAYSKANDEPFVRGRSFVMAIPGEAGQVECLAARGGVLERLLTITRNITLSMNWSMGEAALLVLTGRAPSIRSIVVESVPAFHKIRMTVDPIVSPKVVAEAYKDARQLLLQRRHRSMTEKHLQLAQVKAAKSDTRTWKQLMERWNRQRPKEAYTSITWFARDCTQAYRRLLKYARLADELVAQKSSANEVAQRR